MAFVKHKPQYRNVRTPNAADFGRPRDIRRVLPDARGKIVLPDKSGLPRSFRFSGTPSKNGPFGKRPAFSFTAPAVKRTPVPSTWYRGAAAQIAPMMRGLAYFGAAYDIWGAVDDMLGGEPYSYNSDELWMGGPSPVPGQGPGSGNWQWYYDTEIPGSAVIIPTPDGLGGWSVSIPDDRFIFAIRGWGPVFPVRPLAAARFLPFGPFTKSFPNANGTYHYGVIESWGPAPRVGQVGSNWRLTTSMPVNPARTNSPTATNWDLPNCMNFGPRHSKDIPLTQPIPAIRQTTPWFVPYQGRAPTQEEAALNWPREVISLPRLMPHGNIWRPIPWSAVNAVNAVKGAIGIREENFLDDLGMPRPVPKPQVNHKPAPRGEKEKKARSNNGRLLLFYQAVKKAWHQADEYVEKVDILYDALPGWVRNQERAKMPHEKIAAVIRNLQHIDVADAVYGLIENEVEDAAFGRGFKSLQDAFERMGVRGWRGDLAMSYSTDALFDLYGALKGGL